MVQHASCHWEQLKQNSPCYKTATYLSAITWYNYCKKNTTKILNSSHNHTDDAKNGDTWGGGSGSKMMMMMMMVIVMTWKAMTEWLNSDWPALPAGTGVLRCRDLCLGSQTPAAPVVYPSPSSSDSNPVRTIDLQATYTKQQSKSPEHTLNGK